jgi:hypothetical protein
VAKNVNPHVADLIHAEKGQHAPERPVPAQDSPTPKGTTAAPPISMSADLGELR